MPTYNRRHFIDQAIRSVRAQTYTNWQLIVIDDGSTDDTRQRLENCPDVDYHFQSNKGQAAARNAGLPHCRGEYICSLDSDDEWYPNFLADGVAMLEKCQLDFVFMNWLTSQGNDGYASFFTRFDHKQLFCTLASGDWWLLDPVQNRRLLVETCPSPSSSLLIRRSSFPTAWNEQIRIADDWCMMLDMVMNRPCRSAFNPKPHWTKHIHDTNIWDCRDHIDSIPDVGFHDEKILADRFRHQLTRSEKRIFRRRLAMHHFNYAYFGWKQSVATPKIIRHLGDAFRLAPFLIGYTLATWGQSHLKKRLSLRSQPLTGPINGSGVPLPAQQFAIDNAGEKRAVAPDGAAVLTEQQQVQNQHQAI